MATRRSLNSSSSSIGIAKYPFLYTGSARGAGFYQIVFIVSYFWENVKSQQPGGCGHTLPAASRLDAVRGENGCLES